MLQSLRASLIALALITSTLNFSPAQAAAPMIKKSAPAYYRIMLGDFEVTALLDGTLPLNVKTLLTNTTPTKIDTALTKFALTNPIETSVNGYLINTGNKLVLIDSGTGQFFGPTLGQLITNLQAAGYSPEQVDEIYITHMHPDHIGGLVVNQQIAFPNAIVRADQRDADYWLSPEKLAAAPNDRKEFFKNAVQALTPYIQAGKFKAFTGNTELLPGIQAIAAPGHTAGHTIFTIESRGQKLVLWGDLMHVAAVQFDHPEVTIQFDSDSKAAAAERKKAYADAAKNGYLVGSAHVSFPGLGYVRAQGKGYVWIPVNYSELR